MARLAGTALRILAWLAVRCLQPLGTLAASGGERLSKRIYHFHIPKTGGMSFREDISNMIPAARHRMLSKNECFSWGQEMNLGDVITMMRHPRTQVYSAYRHCV